MNSTSGEKTDPRFKIQISDIVGFVFPSHVQHPLAMGRLYAVGLCGPLDANGQLRSGIKGARVVLDYELEEMCLQFEKEDIISIYLHRPSDLGLLSIKEQEMIINQADKHLKVAKGKTMMPSLTKTELIDMLNEVPKDDEGYLSFHEIQKAIEEFRKERIKRYKLVFPNLVKKKKVLPSGQQLPTMIRSFSDFGPQTTGMSTMSSIPAPGNTIRNPTMGATTIGGDFAGASGTLASTAAAAGNKTHKKRRKKRVSEACAPQTMFLRMQGRTNPEVTEQTTAFLNKLAFKISTVGENSESNLSQNVRLMREVEPRCKNPYERLKGTEAGRLKWDDTCNVKGTGVGSLVKSASSNTTWKRGSTLY